MTIRPVVGPVIKPVLGTVINGEIGDDGAPPSSAFLFRFVGNNAPNGASTGWFADPAVAGAISCQFASDVAGVINGYMLSAQNQTVINIRAIQQDFSISVFGTSTNQINADVISGTNQEVSLRWPGAGGDATLNLDGIDQPPQPSGVVVPSTALNIGDDLVVPAVAFAGLIWDVTVWADEAMTVPLHRWLMNEGSGTTWFDTVGSLDITFDPALGAWENNPATAPLNLASSVDARNISLTWDAAVTGTWPVASYNVYRDSALIANVSGLSYDDPLLAVDWYDYQVAAVDSLSVEGALTAIERVFNSGDYANWELAGGAASGPVDGDNPPTGHTIGFNTVDSFPQVLPAEAGVFEWVHNEDEDSGRCYLTSQLDPMISTPVIVGEIYEWSCLVENVGPTGYTFCTFSSQSGIIDLDIDGNVAPGVTKRVTIAFTIDDLGWATSVRFGVGTTSNVDRHGIVSLPSLRLLSEA